MNIKYLSKLKIVFVEKKNRKPIFHSKFVLYRFFSLLGSSFIDALGLYDQNNVTLLTSPSGRSFIRVGEKSNRRRSNKVHYNCFVNGNYCSCFSFTFNFIQFEKQLWCKHLLAAKLAMATGQFNTQIIQEDDYGEIYRQTFM